VHPVLLLKTVHLLAASVFFGVSLANGLLKTAADRNGDWLRRDWAMQQILLNNRLFILPAALLLPATGLVQALMGEHSLTQGWLPPAILLYAVLVAILAWSFRAESALARLAHSAAADDAQAQAEYISLSRRWSVAGLIATVTMVAVFLLMVTRGSL
jgi:uncharacterized membrane protein